MSTPDNNAKPARPAGHLSGGQVFAGLAIGIGVVWYMASSGPTVSDEPASKVQPSPYMAFIHCQAHVKASLKAPASAQFPGQPLSAIDAGGGAYIVTATVDAQNSFGALLRNDWLCKLQYTGGHPADASSWTLASLSIS